MTSVIMLVLWVQSEYEWLRQCSTSHTQLTQHLCAQSLFPHRRKVDLVNDGPVTIILDSNQRDPLMPPKATNAEAGADAEPDSDPKSSE